MNTADLSNNEQNLLQNLKDYLAAPHPLDTERPEREYLNRITAAAGPELADSARLCFATLLDLQRSEQLKKHAPESAFSADIRNALDSTPQEFPADGTVACPGDEGAYSQQACEKIFARPRILHVRNFDAVFRAVDEGLCDYGVLPIENSLHGTVGAVYDLLDRYRFSIIRACKLPISHALLVRPGTHPEDIREIISHEQALGQCSDFIRSLPKARTVICENTATAARMVSESGRSDQAALASPACAGLYHLQVLKEDVQNCSQNFTRFICISRERRIYPGADRISLIVSLPHHPGALYRLLAKFAALDLNLTKLESRPIPGRDFEFRFYFDLEVSVYSRKIQLLLADLARDTEETILLGCYTEK